MATLPVSHTLVNRNRLISHQNGQPLLSVFPILSDTHFVIPVLYGHGIGQNKRISAHPQWY